MTQFATQYGADYRHASNEYSAYFEIGCFLALLELYEALGFNAKLENLKNGEYRFLTSPNGNPLNFSFVSISKGKAAYQLRQQVRVRSHYHDDICFTPDFVVLREEAAVNSRRDEDYAGGKRDMYAVEADDVVAAHECKSRPPFPELLVSFLGILLAAHSWYKQGQSPLPAALIDHLAPTLFVGGGVKNLHKRMVDALSTAFPINIILGMHYGVWGLKSRMTQLRLIS